MAYRRVLRRSGEQRGCAAQWSRFSPGVNLVIALRLARGRLMRASSADGGARGELGSII